MNSQEMSRLPAGFIHDVISMGLADLPEALSHTAPEVSVRINTSKAYVDFGDTERVPWCTEGYYLTERPSFTLDPAFHQGRYYVQEGASMFHAHIMRHLTAGITSGLRVLDACAAPGGKTTAVIPMLPENSLVVANEYVPQRAAVLRENIIKWGYPSCIVTRGDTTALKKLRETFDIIIADVPCSGEGMMRKDDEAVAQWSHSLVKECAERQWNIVKDLWESLKPGGHLIYSTCTFNRMENEMMVERIISSLGGESVDIPVEAAWKITPGIDTDAFCYRFIPGRTRGEGLFASVIRKSGTSPHDRKEKSDTKNRRKSQSKNPQFLNTAASWITGRDKYDIYMEGDRITAFPHMHRSVLMNLKNHTDVIHEGIIIANVKGRDIIPSQSLAMSTALRHEAFTVWDTDITTALRYLHGESPILPESIPKGMVLITYQDSPLGFVKNLGNRSNSLYPPQWRIRRNID